MKKKVVRTRVVPYGTEFTYDDGSSEVIEGISAKLTSEAANESDNDDDVKSEPDEDEDDLSLLRKKRR